MKHFFLKQATRAPNHIGIQKEICHYTFFW